MLSGLVDSRIVVVASAGPDSMTNANWLLMYELLNAVVGPANGNGSDALSYTSNAATATQY